MSNLQRYRLLIALCGLAGVTMQIYQDGWGMLLYYTVLSNTLVFSFLFFLIFLESKGGTRHTSPRLLRIKGGVTMAIMITCIIYHFMLAPIAKPEDYWNIRNFLVHYIAPIGMILDTLFLDNKKVYRWFDPFSWTIVPLAYFAFAIFNGMVMKLPIPGAVDSPYAYFFINVNKYGLERVLINSAIIAAAYVVVGYILLISKGFIGTKKDASSL
ncbi:Pr6Pr family membrane protein [Streptococcus plurextorum]|uniref:Pr6Pr family membrane protein n=1 Tax=Streptococcus plurextorum TaxID=456876 RepID=UPI0003F83871|nr:Pr6Pr family membrane protein [Streptococcus plurextorum]